MNIQANAGTTEFKSAAVFGEDTALKIDSRGRVRFTSQGTRFEITKNGIKAYDRSSYGEVAAYFNINRLSKATLLLIAEATMLVNG